MPNSEQTRKELLDRIEELIESNDSGELRVLLGESRSSDVAEVVEVLDEIARQILFDLLDPKDAGEVLEKVDEATRSKVVGDLSNEDLTEMVATLPPDEAADVIGDLSQAQSEEVLENIPRAESAQIEQLLRYAEDTAGGIMTTELVKANIDQTVREAIHNFRESDPEEEFYYVFVVDHQNIYQGTISLQKLLRYPRNTAISEIMDTGIPAVNIWADQEEIANTFRKNDLIAMPVVDKNNRLLGRITVDDIVDVMEEEAEEDVLLMAGTHPDELDTASVFKAATVRLPWLITCMMGALVAALTFYSLFRDHFSVSNWSAIVMFIPAIAAMGGNSGMQTSTIVVRGLATGDLAGLDIFQVFMREIRVAAIVSVSCAIISCLVAGGWLYFFPNIAFNPKNGPILGIAVGLSMLCAIMVSTLMGLILPYTFRWLGIDPAISSGPLVTTTNDILSYLVYFSLSLLLINLFGLR
ncbi:MAG: magnesium transporter [Phycisphaerae bacterium]|nr:magnesium transporter [Phycisphaerae bacterium]